jgi:hypothetical protein
LDPSFGPSSVLAYQKLRQESLMEEYFSNLKKKSNEELTPLMPPFLLTVNFPRVSVAFAPAKELDPSVFKAEAAAGTKSFPLEEDAISNILILKHFW